MLLLGFLFGVGGLRVGIGVPAGTRARRGQLLVAGTPAALNESGGVITVTVPSIRDHEVVAIDL
jgi:hypothetical protein